MLRLTNIKTNEIIKKLENYSKPFEETVNTIYLYCKQLCKSTHLIDGKYTNCIHITPLLAKANRYFSFTCKVDIIYPLSIQQDI